MDAAFTLDGSDSNTALTRAEDSDEEFVSCKDKKKHRHNKRKTGIEQALPLHSDSAGDERSCNKVKKQKGKCIEPDSSRKEAFSKPSPTDGEPSENFESSFMCEGSFTGIVNQEGDCEVEASHVGDHNLPVDQPNYSDVSDINLGDLQVC